MPIRKNKTNIFIVKRIAKPQNVDEEGGGLRATLATYVKSGTRTSKVTLGQIPWMTREQTGTEEIMLVTDLVKLFAADSDQMVFRRGIDMRLRTIASHSIAIVLGAIIGFFFCRELAIDGCLDRGGAWNYQHSMCDVD